MATDLLNYVSPDVLACMEQMRADPVGVVMLAEINSLCTTLLENGSIPDDIIAKVFDLGPGYEFETGAFRTMMLAIVEQKRSGSPKALPRCARLLHDYAIRKYEIAKTNATVAMPSENDDPYADVGQMEGTRADTADYAPSSSPTTKRN